MQGNHNAPQIDQRCQNLQHNLDSLKDAATRRKARLIDNSAFLQFIWKTDVVESWICEWCFRCVNPNFICVATNPQKTTRKCFPSSLCEFSEDSLFRRTHICISENSVLWELVLRGLEFHNCE